MKLISLFLIFISLATYPRDMELSTSGSSLQIYGDSNIKKWETKVLKFSGKGSFEVEGDKLKKINSFTIDFDAKDIKSDNDTMDEHTATALEVEKFPKITGMIKESTVVENRVIGAIEFDLHGVKKTLPFNSTFNLSAGKLTVEGEQILNITEFGITPPVTKIIFFSATVKPEIIIKYKLDLEAK